MYFDALTFDYVGRQDMGGTSLSLCIAKQPPIVPPKRYACVLISLIVPRLLGMNHTP